MNCQLICDTHLVLKYGSVSWFFTVWEPGESLIELLAVWKQNQTNLCDFKVIGAKKLIHIIL